MFKAEIKALGEFLKEHYREAAVLGLGVLFMVLYKNHPVNERWVSHLVYFFLLPVAAIVIVLRKNPLDFGLKPGNVKLGLFYVAAALVVIAPVVIYSVNAPSLKRYYAGRHDDLGTYFLHMAALLFAWEFFFRGFLLFGLKERFGAAAILIQMVPFAMMHFGKPEIEILSCIITGVLFGFMAYRCGSFWPAYLAHLVLNVSNRVAHHLIS